MYNYELLYPVDSTSVCIDSSNNQIKLNYIFTVSDKTVNDGDYKLKYKFNLDRNTKMDVEDFIEIESADLNKINEEFIGTLNDKELAVLITQNNMQGKLVYEFVKIKNGVETSLGTGSKTVNFDVSFEKNCAEKCIKYCWMNKLLNFYKNHQMIFLIE